ncbi:hypothetical protein QF022_003664 [Vogesella perlucida]|nr:hypothetical protein [Vogesella perlucida]
MRPIFTGGAVYAVCHLFGFVAGAAGGLFGLAGGVGNAADAARQLRDCAGGAGGGLRLLAGVLADVGGFGRQRGHRLVHLAGTFAHFQQHLPQRLAETVEGGGRGADFVTAVDRQLAGKVAIATGKLGQCVLQA